MATPSVKRILGAVVLLAIVIGSVRFYLQHPRGELAVLVAPTDCKNIEPLPEQPLAPLLRHAGSPTSGVEKRVALLSGLLARDEVVALRLVYRGIRDEEITVSRYKTASAKEHDYSLSPKQIAVGVVLCTATLHSDTYVDFVLSPSGRRTVGVRGPVVVDDAIFRYSTVIEQVLRDDRESVIYAASTRKLPRQLSSNPIEFSKDVAPPYIAILAKRVIE